MHIITYSDLWDTMQAALRGKFIELSAYVKINNYKIENSHTSKLTQYLKVLG